MCLIYRSPFSWGVLRRSFARERRKQQETLNFRSQGVRLSFWHPRILQQDKRRQAEGDENVALQVAVGKVRLSSLCLRDDLLKGVCDGARLQRKVAGPQMASSAQT